MKNKFLPLIAIAFIWVVFSSPFFFAGKTPFPSNYQVNFFSPWNVYPGNKGPVKNNAQPDIVTQIYPWRYFDVQSYKAGQIPFWNPYSFAGTPHLANYQSAALFPLNLLFLLPFSFINVWSFLVLFQPLLAGIFTYILARKLKISKYGSLLSSFSFMFCGFLVTWMGYATLGYAILPFPLALFSILEYSDTKNYKWLVLLSSLFLFSYFSGHFQMSIYFTFGVFAFIFYNLVFSKERRTYTDAFLFSIFGLLMAMPQVLPAIEFYSLSLRSTLFQKVEAIPWSYLPTLISPDFYGNPVTRNDWFGHYAEWSGYAGIIPFTFASAVLLFKRSRTTYFFIGLLVVSLLLAYDTPFLSLLVALKIPVISTSAASRIIVLSSFSIAILSGFGLDWVVSAVKHNRKKLIIWLCVSSIPIFLVALIPLVHILPTNKAHLAQKNSVLSVVLFVFLVLSVGLLCAKKTAKLSAVILLFILLLGAFEMYRFASKWQSFDPKNLAYDNVPIQSFYNSQNHYDRAIGLSGEEDAVYFQMPILSGYDPLYISSYGKFIQYVGSGEYREPERSVVTFPLDGKYTPQAINLLGVKYIVHKVSDGEFAWAFPFKKYPPSQFEKIYDDNAYNVFINKLAYPKTFVVPRSIYATERNKEYDNIFSYDLKEFAITDEQIPNLDPKAIATATIEKYEPNSVTIDVNSSGRSLLVLTDNYYPGWKASVNGVASKIYKADYTFRGIVVPKGKSKVIFSYLPQSFLVGVYLFFIGIMGIIINIVFKKFKFTNA